MTTLEPSQMQSPHNPVLLAEVVKGLKLRDGGIYVDGTFGAGGYSRAMLQGADTSVYAIDQDPNAIADGAGLVAEFDGRLKLLAGRFSQMDELLAGENVEGVDGVTLDIGVSSMQLDQAERGFSFMKDGPLDMRMGKSGLSAADVINTYSESQLKRIIKVYGEEKKAHSIVRAIGRARKDKPFSRTGELAGLIEKVVPVRHGPGKTIHPATRTFQALRIFVNDELGELVGGLAAAERLLKPGGRLAVVSFHSLEDRIIKKFFKRRTGSLPNPSRHLPMEAERDAPSFKEIARGGIVAGEDEVAQNPRARSARLRVGERTDAPFMALEEKERAQGRLEGV